MKILIVQFLLAFLSTLAAVHTSSLVAQDHPVSNSSAAAPGEFDSKYVFYCSLEIGVSERVYLPAKEVLEKTPNVDLAWKKYAFQVIENDELQQSYTEWMKATEVFFSSPNSDNLYKLIGTGETYLKKSPKPDIGCLTRLAQATGYALLAGFYNDPDQVHKYAEKSLQLLASSTPPDRAWSDDLWMRFRTENQGRLWQFQGLAKLRQVKTDPDAAIALLTRAALAKNSRTFKDPNTYILRAEAYMLIYTPLVEAYKKEDNQVGIENIRKKLFLVIDNLIEDYARIIVLTEDKPDLKTIYDEAKVNLATYLKASPRYDKLSEDQTLQLFRKEFGLS